MFKTCPESVEGKAIGAPGLRSKRPLRRSRLGARSVRLVREYDKGPTCLREAAPAEAGNAAGLSAVALAKADALFQHPYDEKRIALIVGS